MSPIELLSDSNIIRSVVIIAITGTTTGITMMIWKIAIAYIQRNRDKELILRVTENGETELVVKGHNTKEETKLIEQLMRKIRSLKK